MSKELPEVRIIRPGDEGEVLAMCRRLHGENGMFSMNDAKVVRCIRKCFETDDEGRSTGGVIIGVIGEPGQIEASICLIISDTWYTDDWHLAETWNYVLPEYRRSGNAEALLEFGKSCSEKMGVPFFTGIITNKQMAGKVRLYRQLLGYPVGAFFVHNCPNWNAEPMVDHSDLRARLHTAATECAGTSYPGARRSRSERRSIPEIDVKAAVTKIRGLAPLLSDAAKAIGREDNIWGAPPKTTNGAATARHANGTD